MNHVKGQEMSITVSDVIEYMFCPRFIFFMYCLTIPQHEEKRFKVTKGRFIHGKKTKLDKKYIRRKLNIIRKEISVYLSSKKYRIRGVVDEVLFLEDGSAAPFDYKFAEYKEHIFKTYKYQSVLYGLMISDIFDVKVHKGFICYIRSNNFVKEIEFKKSDFDNAINIVDEILGNIQSGYYPKKTKYSNKCIDCCYRNICV